MQDSRCSLTSAQYNGTITALILLHTLLLIQTKMLFALLATWAQAGSWSAVCRPITPDLWVWSFSKVALHIHITVLTWFLLQKTSPWPLLLLPPWCTTASAHQRLISLKEINQKEKIKERRNG